MVLGGVIGPLLRWTSSWYSMNGRATYGVWLEDSGAP